jgi:choice-of-anchor B domain-containing protein
MTLLGTGIYPNVSYCHQGWLSEDRRFLYVDDELDEKTQKVATTTTYVFNVEDLTDPKYLTSFTSGRTSIDHNAYVRGRFIYEANYTSGLRVFDLLDPMNVIEVGFFDTRPEEDVIEFRGAWGVYAGLPSGVVLVSDMQRGLFVLDASAVRAMDTAVGWQHYR